MRFERTYPHPIARVWEAVANPAELAHWFPSRVDMEAHAGGTISFAGDPHLDSTTGTVLAYEAPRHLAFTWGNDELHLDLEVIDDQHCRLVLIDVLESRDQAARNATGWSVCLGELDKLLAGTPGHGPHSASAAAWQPVYDDYVASGMPYGADIPA